MANITDWIQAVSAVIIVFISYLALSAWRKQKYFETTIELLNNTQTARDFIGLLRNPSTRHPNKDKNDQYRKELDETKWENSAERQSFVRTKNLEFKEPHLSELFREIIKMRNTSNSIFGKKNEFYVFYSWVISIRDKVIESINELYFLELDIIENDYSLDEHNMKLAKKKILRGIIYRTLIDDIIVNEMEEKINLLEKNSTIDKLQFF